jgi:hypothetical protein
MSTWHELTVTNTKGAPIHLPMMLLALEQHAGYEDDGFDGQKLDHPHEGGRYDPEVKAWVGADVILSRVEARWSSKYTDEPDLEAVSKFLGPDFLVDLSVSWEGDGEPGSSRDVYRDGVHDDVVSNHNAVVSDALGNYGDALIKPQIVTREEAYHSPAGFPEGTRFLVLPPEKKEG